MRPPRHAESPRIAHGSRSGGSRVAFLGGSRVAFFGGSFDPPHWGHLTVARAARDAFALDRVLFAPVGVQPLKPTGAAAGFADRLAMTRLAIAGEPCFEVSALDAPREGSDAPNYTIDTLEGLRSTLAAGSTLFCLLGADSFLALRHWRRAAEIPFVAPLIVASRPGQPLDRLQDALPPGLTLEPAPPDQRIVAVVEVRSFHLANPRGDRTPFYVLPGLHVEISASQIRKEIHAQRQTAPGSAAVAGDLVPAAVRDYIAGHSLYRS